MKIRKLNIIIFVVSFSFLIFSIVSFFGVSIFAKRIIKVSDNIYANEYFSSLGKLKNIYPEETFIIIYLADICMSCPTGWIVNQCSERQKESNALKFIILLPNTFTKNDIKNLKTNHNFKIEFLNISEKFQKLIDKRRSRKFKTPYSGLCFVVNSKGMVSYQKYLTNQKGHLKKQFEELINNSLKIR